MLRVARIEQVRIAIVDLERSQQDCPGIAAIVIAEQPGIVALARHGSGYVTQVDQHFVADALTAALANLPAAEIGNVTGDDRPRGSRIRETMREHEQRADPGDGQCDCEQQRQRYRDMTSRTLPGLRWRLRWQR